MIVCIMNYLFYHLINDLNIEYNLNKLKYIY